MKSQIKLILIIVLLSLIPVSGVYSQESCKVLKAGIDSAYAGACKKDLAHGIGEAWGLDHYTGDFKKGLPHGKGIYEYNDGSVYNGAYSKGFRHGYGEYTTNRANIDTILKGIWNKDLFVGPVIKGKERDYQVIRQLEVNRYNVIRQSDEKKIAFRIHNNVSSKPEVFNVAIHGSSGQRGISNDVHYFENVSFPFFLRVNYNKWDKLGFNIKEVEFEIEITREGEWKIDLY